MGSESEQALLIALLSSAELPAGPPLFSIVLFLPSVVFGAITGLIARYRKRSFIAWFFIGCLLSPLIAGPLLFIFPRGDKIHPPIK